MSDYAYLSPKAKEACEQAMRDARQAQSELAAPAGSVTPDALIVAFVQGAQWWEYHKTGATMWASDRDRAEGEAEKRAANGTLGKSPNEKGQR